MCMYKTFGRPPHPHHTNPPAPPTGKLVRSEKLGESRKNRERQRRWGEIEIVGKAATGREIGKGREKNAFYVISN